ncbi:hypothetical protein PYW08_010457 [Mythimna loreyi]|uniref:Uncharacterized protein n=1 Tax=Mythimna loreyi TaxID=667449 RepID=A0ACC2Q4U5_9NEOP|nr:hypothetical protein PYW08_010457 [Mythimna loreyi]
MNLAPNDDVDTATEANRSIVSPSPTSERDPENVHSSSSASSSSDSEAEQDEPPRKKQKRGNGHSLQVTVDPRIDVLYNQSHMSHITHTQETRYQFPSDGRFGLGMGCPLGREINVRFMVNSPKDMAQQQKRALCRRYNTIADRLSRGRQPTEWHLLPRATAEVFQKWGYPEIDLFATRETAVVRNYVSIDCKDRLANYTDAFSRPWKSHLAWVFPPPSLLPRVLTHLNSATGVYLVVAPDWPRAFWLQDLKSRALDHPHEIRNLSETMIDFSTLQPPPQVQSLTLKVWKVGGGVLK